MRCSLAFRVFAAVLALGQAGSVVASTTQRCNPAPVIRGLYGTYNDPNDPVVLSILAAVRAPASNPELFERLQRPTDARSVGTVSPILILDYDPVQDIDEIAARVRAQPDIVSRFNFLNVNGVVCFATSPPPTAQVVTEYHNTLLNHYFLSSSAMENAAIDNGAAGPGWVRTGQAWQTFQDDVCSAPAFRPVYRFYGTPGIGPNSHFFTANPDECGSLRRGIGWGFEGFAFGAALPIDGACLIVAPVKVYRLYNNRWMFNDSNHRYTTSLAIYESMQAQGWIGEGVQLCVTAVGAP